MKALATFGERPRLSSRRRGALALLLAAMKSTAMNATGNRHRGGAPVVR